MTLLTMENKEILAKRVKSLAWRAGSMLLALGIQFTLDNLGLLNLPSEAVVVLGLLLGELSKHLNNKLSQ